MSRNTRCKRNRKRITRRMSSNKRAVNARRNHKRRSNKCLRKKTKQNRDGRNYTRKRSIKGGALCPDSEDIHDIYDIGGPNKQDNIIASSSYYVYKDVNIPTVVFKEIPVKGWVTREDVENEFENARKAGEIGVGPKVEYTTFCEIDGETIGYLVMQYIEGETLKTEDMQNGEIVDQINNLFITMAENDMYQGEIHSMNIMIGKTNTDSSDRVYFIDFAGLSKVDGRPPRTAEEIELLE